MVKLEKAITLIKAGNKTEARPILADILKADLNNEHAWLWMSACVDSDVQRRDCIENIFRINPQSELAQYGLVLLDQKKHLPPKPKLKPLKSHSRLQAVKEDKQYKEECSLKEVDQGSSFAIYRTLAAFGTLAVIAGAFGPWFTVISSGVINETLNKSGMEGDGPFVLFCGAIAAIEVLTMKYKPGRFVGVWTALFAFFAGFFAIYDIFHAYSLLEEIRLELGRNTVVSLSIDWGLPLIIMGAGLLFFVGLSKFPGSAEDSIAKSAPLEKKNSRTILSQSSCFVIYVISLIILVLLLFLPGVIFLVVYS
ncbi:MAG: hypothetical protein KDJ52_08560 [Anaerolineae bacterium]|nr:hypothetical protein [Anaerolineae bacterium]